MSNKKKIVFALVAVLMSMIQACNDVKYQNTWKAIAPHEHTEVSLFEVPDDLELTVWAKTPLLYNAVNIDVDADNRIWVVEGVNHRKEHEERRPAGDRVVVLEDSNNDGKADISQVFYQGTELVVPMGLSVVGAEVIVSQAPSIFIFKDRDGDRVFDGKVDKREEFLTGFNGKNNDHSVHTMTVGPDGNYYFSCGNMGSKFTDRDGKTFRIGSWLSEFSKAISGQKSDDGNIYLGGYTARISPEGKNTKILVHNTRNTFEHTLNSFGDLFQADNDDSPGVRATIVLENGNAGYASENGLLTFLAEKRLGQSHFAAHWHQDDPGIMPAGDGYGVGSPTGQTFYENGALPQKYEGMFLTCDARLREIFYYQPSYDETGQLILGKRKILVSLKDDQESPNFVPTDVVVGADGALYFSDWHDPRFCCHQDDDVSTSGTIYRLAPKGFKSEIKKTGLRSPAKHVRAAAFKEMIKTENNYADVADLLNENNRFVSARAIWLLPYMGTRGQEKMDALLNSDDATKIVTGLRALRLAGKNVELLRAYEQFQFTQNNYIKKEILVGLYDMPLSEKQEIWLNIAKGLDGENRLILEALGLAAHKAESPLWKAYIGNKPALEYSKNDAQIAWRLHLDQMINDLKVRAMSSKLSIDQRKYAVESMAFNSSKEAAIALLEVFSSTTGVVKSETRYWLVRNKYIRWKTHQLHELYENAGIKEDDLISVLLPGRDRKVLDEGRLKKIQSLKGDVNRGRIVANRCISCHQINGQGIQFGPELRGYAKSAGSKRVLEDLVDPDSTIHFANVSYEVVLVDSTRIHGNSSFLLMTKREDPVFISSVGGIMQYIPVEKVSKVTRLSQSLMLSAEQLGLTDQDLADVVAFLQQYN